MFITFTTMSRMIEGVNMCSLFITLRIVYNLVGLAGCSRPVREE